MDNYELLHVTAARLVQVFRRVKFVLVYSDGSIEDGRRIIHKNSTPNVKFCAENQACEPLLFASGA
jgi:hypothetical protein